MEVSLGRNNPTRISWSPVVVFHPPLSLDMRRCSEDCTTLFAIERQPLRSLPRAQQQQSQQQLCQPLAWQRRTARVTEARTNIVVVQLARSAAQSRLQSRASVHAGSDAFHKGSIPMRTANRDQRSYRVVYEAYILSFPFGFRCRSLILRFLHYDLFFPPCSDRITSPFLPGWTRGH